MELPTLRSGSARVLKKISACSKTCWRRKSSLAKGNALSIWADFAWTSSFLSRSLKAIAARTVVNQKLKHKGLRACARPEKSVSRLSGRTGKPLFTCASLRFIKCGDVSTRRARNEWNKAGRAIWSITERMGKREAGMQLYPLNFCFASP
jgi:hypothetical protein